MKKTTIISLLLVACMATMCFVGGTFAKYTSEISGTDSARVAKWDIKINNVSAAATETFTFDLFNTIKDSDGASAETDVADTETIIAPGTSGSFDIVLNNASEVNAKYAIAFQLTNAGVPLQFKVGEGEWKSTLDPVAETTIDMGDSETVTVQWRWVYETDPLTDDADTALGLVGTAAPSVIATVTATQVD